MSAFVECNVFLWGKLVGTIAHLKNKIYFQYDKQFLDTNIEISPLHLALSNTVYDTSTLTYNFGLAGVFSDSLPDSWGNSRFNINDAKEIIQQQIEVINTFGKRATDIGISKIKIKDIKKGFKLN